MFHPLTIYI
jgi:signal peptidase complex subunit 2